jgi:hypothetical protein
MRRQASSFVAVSCADRGATAHLRLELDAERMTDDERKAAANALRRALGLLKKAAKPND